ncbi:MAG: helix-turn-helix transcriptional regulator [Clostridia bacterium]|nr:helix-turn-helix transcriptional regulator [Clostridia bacterium]
MPPKYVTANYTMMDLYFAGLRLEPNCTYCCTLDCLGGELELHVSEYALEKGALVHIPPSPVWKTHTFSFQLGSQPRSLDQFENYGISFNKTLWPEHANGAVIADTYVDNFRIYKTDDPEQQLVDGGDFESQLSDPIYDRNWRRKIFGKKGKAFGVARVTDPLNPHNHCLKLPSVVTRPVYAPSIELRAVSFGHIDSNPRPVENIVLEAKPQHHLLLVESGAVSLGDTVIEKGNLLYFPPYSTYHYCCHPHAEALYYWLTVDGSDADVLFGECGLTEACVTPLANPRSLTQRIDEMLRVTEDGVMQQYELNAHLQLLLTHLQRQIAPIDINRHHRAQLKEIVYRIARYPERPISNAELAKTCGISEHYFITLFKQYTGDTPQEHRRKVLIHRACNLLETTDLSIQEISYLLGLDDPLYFSRLFRRIQGVSPRQYRQKLK